MKCMSVPRTRGLTRVQYLIAIACAVLLSACATTPAGSTTAAAGPTAGGAVPTAPAGPATADRPTVAASGAIAPAPAVPGAPRPFAEVIKDATQISGLFPVWQKDDRTWIEIPSEMLDQPFFLSIGLTRGLGERWLIGGLQGGSHATGGEYIGQFRKAAGKPGLSAETRAHFAEAAETLGEALKAPLIRTGV